MFFKNKCIGGKMKNKKMRLGMLAMAMALGVTVAGCVSSYHIQTFSNEVQTLPSKTIEKTDDKGKKTEVTVYEGLFKGADYESALQKAQKAGFTEILSIEYGTYSFLFLFGSKWVALRCTKEAGAEGGQTNATNPPSRTPAAQQSNSRTGQQTSGTPAVPQLSEATIIQQALNRLPAVPIAGKNLKFEFGGDAWFAKVNGENFLAGKCIFENIDNGYNLTLQTTNVWTGAVEEVIDLLQKVGVPLGPAAGPLRTAARLAARFAKWIPLEASAIILKYVEGPPANISFVKMEK
jgi:outer membrane murein-binding lipoprotein Lpp